jgi:ubiquinone/menaquinone biosynthesis C-methylase UbiE
VAGRQAGAANPFADDPTRRWAFAFDALAGLDGTHVDVGIGDAEIVTALRHAGRSVVGLDVHAGYLASARASDAALALVRIGHRDAWPLRDESVASVSLLDTLEHVADESHTLREAERVLVPDGQLVVTVPARHVFSFLDPGNAKLRYPRLHRLAYTARHGGQRYAERFEDLADGLRGDLSVERTEHTNYRAGELIDRLAAAGFEVWRRDGANLFWRFFQVPQLLTRGRLARAFDAPLRWDGRRFHRANLFLLARKVRGGG